MTGECKFWLAWCIVMLPLLGCVAGMGMMSCRDTKTPAECRAYCDAGHFVLARLDERGFCRCADSYSQRVRVIRR